MVHQRAIDYLRSRLSNPSAPARIHPKPWTHEVQPAEPDDCGAGSTSTLGLGSAAALSLAHDARSAHYGTRSFLLSNGRAVVFAPWNSPPATCLVDRRCGPGRGVAGGWNPPRDYWKMRIQIRWFSLHQFVQQAVQIALPNSSAPAPTPLKKELLGRNRVKEGAGNTQV